MLKQPILKPDPKTGLYILHEDYEHGGHVVSKGFAFDGASIPPPAQFLTYTPFHPMVIAPALVHDDKYTKQDESRKEADIIFREMLILNGVDDELAYSMYYAVRLFGRGHYG